MRTGHKAGQFRHVLRLMFAMVLVTSCGTSTVGGSRTSIGGQPNVSRDFCESHCVEFGLYGRCVRFSGDMAEVCARYLDREALPRTPATVASARLSTDDALAPLAQTLCSGLKYGQGYRIAVSSRGPGFESVPPVQRELLLGALERTLASQCSPPHSIVSRTTLRPALEELERSGLESDISRVLDRLRKNALADVLVVPSWRTTSDTVWMALQALDVRRDSDAGPVILSQSTERPVLHNPGSSQ